MRTIPIFLTMLAMLAVSAPAMAQQPDANAPGDPNTPGDTDRAKDAEEIRAIVRSVKGICEKRSAAREDAKWTAIKKNDKLGGMTLVRTGLGGEVELAFSDRVRMTVRQATKIGIREFYMQGTKASGQLGVKYGSVRAKVNSAAGENDVRVSTPVATLSVRGSGGTLTMWGDLGLYFRGQSGRWVLTNPAGQKQGVTKGEWTDGDGNRSGELLAMFRHVPFGDPLGGLTQRELRYLRGHGDGRGVIGFVGSGHQFTQLMAFEYHSSGNGSQNLGSGDYRVGGGENDEGKYGPGGNENGEYIEP